METNPDYLRDFSFFLRRSRLQASLSQADVASIIGIHTRLICSWETGTTLPSKERTRSVVNAYQTNFEEFFARYNLARDQNEKFKDAIRSVRRKR